MKPLDNGVGSGIMNSEIENIGNSGKINISPKQIDADKLSFVDNHINNDNARNISEENAKNYVKTANNSITKWRCLINMENNKFVHCPLIDDKIENIECITNTSCIDEIINMNNMPEKFKKKDNYSDICKSCKWHNY